MAELISNTSSPTKRLRIHIMRINFWFRTELRKKNKLGIKVSEAYKTHSLTHSLIELNPP
jgi:hypothetical protein